MEKHIIIDTLQELCNDGIRENEVPVAALIVENDKIISKAYNLVEKTHDFMNHAEIIAIKNAIALKKNWRLDKCTLYVTLEPCTMCAAAISFARIKNLYFGALDEKGGAVLSGVKFYDSPTCHHKPNVISGILAQESSELLKEFFKNKRN